MQSTEEFRWGWPARLDKSLDLTDREIYKALITDSSSGPWVVSKQILSAASSGKAAISLNLLRDIHLFVIRVAKSRTLAYVREKDEFRPTALGIELSRIESALKSGIPSKYSQYSEHVQLFLDAYTALGMDGGRGKRDVIVALTGGTGLRNEFPDALVSLIRARYAAIPTKGYDKGRFSPTIKQVVYTGDDAPLYNVMNFKRKIRMRRDKSVKNNRKAAKFIFRAFQHDPELVLARPRRRVFTISRHGNPRCSGFVPPSIERHRGNTAFFRKLRHLAIQRRHHLPDNPLAAFKRITSHFCCPTARRLAKGDLRDTRQLS